MSPFHFSDGGIRARMKEDTISAALSQSVTEKIASGAVDIVHAILPPNDEPSHSRESADTLSVGVNWDARYI